MDYVNHWIPRRLEQAAEEARSRPAKAGIQEARPGGEGMAEFIGCPYPVIAPLVVIPALRE